MLRVGLTGGIGSGKSTVAAMLVNAGAALIDADTISRSLSAAGGAAIAPLIRQFGQDIIAPDGSMDRSWVRDRIFTNPVMKSQLEAIIHPLVKQACETQASEARAAGKSFAVFDIPLLVESDYWRGQLDCIVVVDCLESTQISRVMQRSGWTLTAVEKVMATQASRAQRLAAADIVIYNEGVSLQELQLQVQRLLVHLKL